MRRRSVHLNWRALALLGALLSIAIEWPGLVHGMPAALLPASEMPSPLPHILQANASLRTNGSSSEMLANSTLSGGANNATLFPQGPPGERNGSRIGESVSDNKQLHSIMTDERWATRTFSDNSSASTDEPAGEADATVTATMDGTTSMPATTTELLSNSHQGNSTEASATTTPMPLETSLNRTTTTAAAAVAAAATSTASPPFQRRESNSSLTEFTFSSSQHIAILSRTERSVRERTLDTGSSSGTDGGESSDGGIVRRSSDINGGLAKSKRLSNSRNANSSNNDNLNTSSNHHNTNSNSRHHHHNHHQHQQQQQQPQPPPLQQQQPQQAISNLDRNERSTISHLSGPARKIQLYIKNRFIQLLPDGTVNGTQDELSEYTILQRSTVDVGRIKIQGVATCLYLCMDPCGAVYSSKDFTDDCVFNENMEQHNYNTYSSTYNSNARKKFFLALNRHGEPRRLQIPPTRSLGKLATYTNAITETVPQERVDQLIAKNFGANRIKHGIRQLCDTGKPLIELIDSRNFKARPQCNPTSSGTPPHSHSSSSPSPSSAGSSNKSPSPLGSGRPQVGSPSSNGQIAPNVPAANDNSSRLSSSSSAAGVGDGERPQNVSSNSDSNSSSISHQNGHISSSPSSASTAASQQQQHQHPHQTQKKKKKRRKCRPNENEEEHNCHRGPLAELRRRANGGIGGGGGGNGPKQQRCRQLLLQQQQQQQQGNATSDIVVPKNCNAGPKKGGGGPKKNNMGNNKKARPNRPNAGGGPNRGKKPGNGPAKNGKVGGGAGPNGGPGAKKKKAKNQLGPGAPKKGGGGKKKPTPPTTTVRSAAASLLLGLETTSQLPSTTIYNAFALRGGGGETTSDRGDREQRNARFTNSMEQQEDVSGEEVVDGDDEDSSDENTDSYEEEDSSSAMPAAVQPSSNRAPVADEGPASMNSGADDFLYYDQFDL